MKRNTLFTIILCSAALISACKTSEQRTNMMAKQSNGQIVGNMKVLNKNEIAAAAEAKTRATHPAVKKYAQSLYQAHTRNLQKLTHLDKKWKLQSEMSSISRSLERQGQQQLSQLSTADKTTFDKTYLSYMINDHQEALRLIDQEIANSSNAALTQYLKDTRQHVALHLEKAQQLQNQVNH